MMLKVLEKDRLPAFLEGLQEEGELCAPVRKDGAFIFAPVSSPAEVAYDYPTTILPPKKFFLPPWETLLRFRRSSWVIEPAVDSTDRVIFGMHPCDIHATWLLDEILSETPGDPPYLSRRRRAAIVGLDCTHPCDSYAFCRSMNTHNVETGFDILLTDLGDVYMVQVDTPRGMELLERHAQTGEVRYEHRIRMRTIQRDKEDWPRPLEVSLDELPWLLGESFDSLLWDVLGERCLACGSCNLVCPTCYCFDVQDNLALDLDQGERVRRWDSCQLLGFAKVASGENFRERRSDRQRHRFLRKGKYLRERYGRFACVGCGRCARACVVGINPVEVYNQLKGGV